MNQCFLLFSLFSLILIFIISDFVFLVLKYKQISFIQGVQVIDFHRVNVPTARSVTFIPAVVHGRHCVVLPLCMNENFDILYYTSVLPKTTMTTTMIMIIIITTTIIENKIIFRDEWRPERIIMHNNAIIVCLTYYRIQKFNTILKIPKCRLIRWINPS